jgi:cell division protein FtsB
MTPEMKKIWNSKRAKQLFDIRNIGLYVFGIVVLAITWSGVRTVQSNYELQKKVSELKQQNVVLGLENGNTGLQNKYLQTDQYLELAARQNLGLTAPGETVLLVPKTTAMKNVDPSLGPTIKASNTEIIDHRTKFAKNLEDWRDFLLGRKLSDD